MSELPMREMSLTEILSELPIGHRARKEWNETLHRLSTEKNNRLEIEQALAIKLKKESKSDGDNIKFNNIFLDCENFVKNNKVSREETHIDFNVLSENFVTWMFSDEPELATTPSCYVRSIVDIKKINKLKFQLEQAQTRISNIELELEKVKSTKGWDDIDYQLHVALDCLFKAITQPPEIE